MSSLRPDCQTTPGEQVSSVADPHKIIITNDKQCRCNDFKEFF